MARRNKILLLHIKFLFIAIFFCTIGSSVVLAQEESAVEISHHNQEQEPFPEEENLDLSKMDKANQNFWEQQRSAIQLKEANKEQNTKQGGDKGAAGTEGMSTLSFNLFLYVVDKFKEKEDI